MFHSFLDDYRKYSGVVNGQKDVDTRYALVKEEQIREQNVQDVILLDRSMFSDAELSDFREFAPVTRFGLVFVVAKDSVAVFDRSKGSLRWDAEPMAHRTDPGAKIGAFAVSADGGTLYLLREDDGVIESRTLRRWQKECLDNSRTTSKTCTAASATRASSGTRVCWWRGRRQRPGRKNTHMTCGATQNGSRASTHRTRTGSSSPL